MIEIYDKKESFSTCRVFEENRIIYRYGFLPRSGLLEQNIAADCTAEPKGENMKKGLLIFASISVGMIAVIFFIYACYWTVKTVSYNLFYEDMVRASITEMVKPEALRQPAPSPD